MANKENKKKLSLKRESLKLLNEADLTKVVGGGSSVKTFDPGISGRSG